MTSIRHNNFVGVFFSFILNYIYRERNDSEISGMFIFFFTWLGRYSKLEIKILMWENKVYFPN